MAGRRPNAPHRVTKEREHTVPTVLFDYAFVSKTGDEKSLTILVTKERESRVLMADVVLKKGRTQEETVAQAVQNVKRLGHYGTKYHKDR